MGGGRDGGVGVVRDGGVGMVRDGGMEVGSGGVGDNHG